MRYGLARGIGLVGGATTGGLVCYLNEKKEKPEEVRARSSR